jgi:hypothetical protein
MLRMFSSWRGRFIGLTAAMLGALGATAPSSLGQGGPQLRVAAGEQQSPRRCGTRERSDVEMALDAARMADFTRRHGARKPGAAAVTINTYVHVIHDGEEGLVSDRMIRDQMAVLNDAYAAYGIQFALAASVRGNPNPDYTDNAAWYRDDELAYKSALKEGSGDDLNIYINNGGGYLGYAYYPTIVGTEFDVLDGVVLAWGTLPNANQPGISDIPGFVYNLGDTGTHEVGHYLGLAHTFEGGCSRTNDGVADTPAEKSADFYCSVGRNSCKDGNRPVELDPIHNFMDYSDDVCLFEFTGGQAERMNTQWAVYRQGR